MTFQGFLCQSKPLGSFCIQAARTFDDAAFFIDTRNVYRSDDTLRVNREVSCKGRKELEQLEIRVNGNDIERALKLLKRQLQKDGLLKELKKRRYYEKPSVKLKSKQREAQKRRIKTARQARHSRSVN